jgi:hypothetical protein
MGKTDYLPSNILAYSNLVHNIRTQAGINQSRWDISPAAIAALDPLIADLDAAVKVSENPLTRTSAAICKRNEARIALDMAMRLFIQGRLRHNPRITGEDLRAMGLPVYDRTATLSPDPLDKPLIKVFTPSPGIIEFRFGTKTGKRYAKPKGIRGVEIRWILSETPPVDWLELLHSESATHLPLRLSFEGHDRGKWIYFAARWENTRGVKGPWTEILSAVIP